jgi:CRP-like cAMP-binding protein
LLTDFLRKVGLFKDLDDAQLALLAAIAQEEAHPARYVIFREGDPVEALYLVREGLVTVYRETPGQPLEILARLEEGGFFGEIGLLNDKAHRVASARTLLPSVLLRIDKQDLVPLLTNNPVLELKFRAEVLRRHGVSASALLALAGQRDVRIQLGVGALVETEDGRRLTLILENLSLGGVGLSRVPADWQPGHEVRFTLGHEDEPALLDVHGRVSWREGDHAGIAFDPATIGDARRIYRALRSFLDANR